MFIIPSGTIGIIIMFIIPNIGVISIAIMFIIPNCVYYTKFWCNYHFIMLIILKFGAISIPVMFIILNLVRLALCSTSVSGYVSSRNCLVFKKGEMLFNAENALHTFCSLFSTSMIRFLFIVCFL